MVPTTFGSGTIFGERSNGDRWAAVRDAAFKTASMMAEAPDPPSLEVINRILFPYDVCQIVMTSTQWLTVIDQITAVSDYAYVELASQITQAIRSSSPTKLENGEWHLPFIYDSDIDGAIWHAVDFHGPRVLLTDGHLHEICINLLTRVSVSRTLSGAKLNEDRIRQIKNDLALFSQFDGPFVKNRRDAYDHQATPDEITNTAWLNTNLHGNLIGWCQYRQIAQWEGWNKTDNRSHTDA